MVQGKIIRNWRQYRRIRPRCRVPSIIRSSQMHQCSSRSRWAVRRGSWIIARMLSIQAWLAPPKARSLSTQSISKAVNESVALGANQLKTQETHTNMAIGELISKIKTEAPKEPSQAAWIRSAACVSARWTNLRLWPALRSVVGTRGTAGWASPRRTRLGARGRAPCCRTTPWRTAERLTRRLWG